MLRFTEYSQLDEKARTSARTTRWLKRQAAPYAFWLDADWLAPLPISGPMMKRLGLAENASAIHITHMTGLLELVSNQNSSKAISVMTKVDPAAATNLFSRGVGTKGGVAVELEGDISITAPFDIWSKPDNQGRRWFDMDKLADVLGTDQIQDWVVDYSFDIAKVLKTVTGKVSSKLLADLKTLGFDLQRNDYGWAKSDPKMARDWWLQVKKYLSYIKDHQKSLRRTDPEGLEAEYKRATKEVNKHLQVLTKTLFDTAEKSLKQGLPILQNALLQGNYQNVKYTEGIMRKFKIKEVWYDLDLVSEQISDPDVADTFGLDIDNDEGLIDGIEEDDFFGMSDLADKVLRKLLKRVKGVKIKTVQDNGDIDNLFNKYKLRDNLPEDEWVLH